MASVFPASAALVNQVRASASSGGSSLVTSRTPRLPERRCSRLRRPWCTRCGPRPAPVGPAGRRAAGPEVDLASVFPASAALVYQVRASSSSGGSSRVASSTPRLYLASVFPASAALVHQVRASASSGGSSWSASSNPRLYWASVFPASAALVHQVRASASSGGSSRSASRPRGDLGVGVPGFGGLGVPGAGLGQLRRVQPVREQQPEVVLGVGVPGFGGLGVPGAGLGQLRRVQPVASSTPEVELGVGVPGFGGLGHQVRASASSGGSSRRRAAARGRTWASVFPASAALVHQVRASASSGGSSTVASSTPEVVLGVGVPGFGGLGVPGAGLGQLRRVQPGGEQHARGCPGRRCSRLRRPWCTRCGPRPAPAGPAGRRAVARGRTWASVFPASAALVHQVRASASSGGSSGCEQLPRGRTGRRCSRLRRPWCTRCGPRPAPAGPAGRRAAPRG